MLQQLKYPSWQLSDAMKHGMKMKYRYKTQELNTFYTLDFHIKFNIWLINADDYDFSPAKYCESGNYTCRNNWSIHYDNYLMLWNMKKRWNKETEHRNLTHFLWLIMIIWNLDTLCKNSHLFTCWFFSNINYETQKCTRPMFHSINILL